LGAEAALGRSLVTPEVSPLLELNVCSADIGEEGLYGGFSPRVSASPQLHPEVPATSESEDITAVMAPVMLIMTELQEFCGKLAPLSMVHLEVDSIGSLAVASTPPSLEPNQSVGLADSEARFAKELCDLLASLEAVSPGSSKEIVRLLSKGQD
jgi:hypothetical protein